MTPEQTTWLAIYGAALSTGVALFNIWREIKNKGDDLRITIDYEIRMNVDENILSRHEKLIHVTIINIGRRPCTVFEFGIVHSPTFWGQVRRRLFGLPAVARISGMQLKEIPKRLEAEEAWQFTLT